MENASPNVSDKQTSSPSPLSSPVTSENTISSDTFYRKKSTVLIEAQPLKIHIRKRKSDAQKNEELPKKRKSSTTNVVNTRESKGKKKVEKAVVDRSVSKVEKKKIAQVRKGKLKELAIKVLEEEKSSENKSRINKPKVKVSEGRGNFLLDNIEAGPSTSKAKNTCVVRKTATNNGVKRIVNGQTSPVVRTGSNDKRVYVDTNSEVKEILSWNPLWLTKNADLAHLNPVVRLKKLKPLENYYSSYQKYFEMNHSLLMVELWAHIQKEFELNK